MTRKKAKEDFYKIANLLEHPIMATTDVIRARLEIRQEELLEFLEK